MSVRWIFFDLGSTLIDETEAKTIKQIFILSLTGGHGYKVIANSLNESGIRSKRGNLFEICTVKNILENSLYTGIVQYNLYKEWTQK